MASASTSKEYKLAIKIAGAVSSSFDRAIGEAGQKISNLGSIAQAAAATAAAAWGALKLGEFISDAIAIGSEYENAFAKVQTIMDQTQMGSEEMSSAIKALSNETGVAAAELSDSVYNAISATGDTANAVSLVGDATKLATAGLAESGEALSVLSTVMNAYGMSADEAGKISDSLIMTQNRGVTTVGALASSMGKAIATASAYSVDLTNLEASYISLTKAGISTEESTTYLSSMLKELGSSSTKVAKIIKSQTGKSFGQMMSDGASLADVFNILVKSVNGDSEALINLWSSAEAGKAANAIASQGIDYFRESLDALNNSTGLTEEAYKTMASTFAHQSQLIKTNWDNLGISVFDSISGPMARILKLVNGAMPTIQGAISTAAGNIGNLVANGLDYAIPRIEAFKDRAVELFGMASEGIGKVVSAHSGTFDKLGELGSRIGDIFASIQEKAQPVLDYIFSTGIPNIVDGLLGLVDRLADLGIFLTEHKELVIAAIAAYAGFKTISGVSSLMGKLNDASNVLSEFERITHGTSLAASAASGKLPKLSAAFGVLTGKIKLTDIAAETYKAKMASLSGGFKTLGTIGKNAFTGLKTGIFSIGITLAGLGSKIMAFIVANPAVLVIAAIAAVIAIVVTLYNKCEWFRQKVDAIIETVKGYLSAFWEKAKEVFQKVWGIVQEVWGQIQPYLAAAWQAIISAVSAVVSFFQTNVLPGIKAVWSSICGVFAAAWELIKAVWNTVKPFFLAIWETIKAIFSVAAEVLGGFFKAAWSVIQLVWAAVSPWFAAIWENIKAVFTVVSAVLGGFFTAAWEAIKAVWNTATAFFQAIFDTIAGIFSVLTSLLSGDFSGAWETIKGIAGTWAAFFGTVWDGIKAVFGAVASWFSGIFTAAWTGIKNVITAGLNAVRSSVSGFWGKLDDLTGGAVTRIAEFFTGLWAGIKGLWNGAATWFRNTVITPITNFFSPLIETVSGIFRGLWIIVQAIWVVVAGWFKNSVITPVVNFFAPIVATVGGFFSSLWSGIQGVWAAVSGWFDTTVIKPLVGFFSAIPGAVGGFFSSLWGSIQTIWATVSGWFDMTVVQPLIGFFSPIVEQISGFFTNLWNNICSIWQAAGSWFSDNVATPINNAFQSVGDFVKGVFNGLIGFVESMINRVIGGINKLIGGFSGIVEKAAGFLGVEWDGIAEVPTVSLPRLAKGGIVTAPTLLEAGEAGDEAIIPLPELWGNMQDMIAASMNGATDGIAALANRLDAADIGASTPSIEDLLSRLDGTGNDDDPDGGGPPPMQIIYSPTNHYHFEGDAPSNEEIAGAESMSQDEFNRRMDQWLKDRQRTNFRG